LREIECRRIRNEERVKLIEAKAMPNPDDSK